MGDVIPFRSRRLAESVDDPKGKISDSLANTGGPMKPKIDYRDHDGYRFSVTYGGDSDVLACSAFVICVNCHNGGTAAVSWRELRPTQSYAPLMNQRIEAAMALHIMRFHEADKRG